MTKDAQGNEHMMIQFNVSGVFLHFLGGFDEIMADDSIRSEGPKGQDV